MLKDKLSLEFRRGEGPRRPKLTFESRKALTMWMSEKTLVSWVIVDEPWLFEVSLIQRFTTPLNLDCNMHHPFFRELSRIRSKVLGEASRS